jgi:WD40 repeat protein
MRTCLFILGACVVSRTSAPVSASAQAPAPATVGLSAAPNRPLDYSGVYISTPDEDYFTPCGSEGAGDTWSLRFRDNEPHAPLIKKATAVRGYPPLTHFIRVRGRLGPPGSYNIGFQTRELAVDSVVDVKETLEPCAGYGTPAAWSRMPARFRNLKGTAMSTDRRLAALMDIDGSITLWSTETGTLVGKLGSVAKGPIESASYGPMTFSDDGRLLAVSGNDGVVHVWRPRDLKRVFSLHLKDSAAVAKERAKTPPPKGPQSFTGVLSINSNSATTQLVFNRRGTMLATTICFRPLSGR